jgi:hypothetical protein
MGVVVCLSPVLGGEILVWEVGVTFGAVGVVVMMAETEMLEDAGVLEEIVRHVEMLVGVRLGVVGVLRVRAL